MQIQNEVPIFLPEKVVCTKNEPSILECKVGNGVHELTISIRKPITLKNPTSKVESVKHNNLFLAMDEENVQPKFVSFVQRSASTVSFNGNGVLSNTTLANSSKNLPSPKIVDAVVCMLDEEECYVYWKESVVELSINRKLTDKEQVRRGNWLALTIQETPDGYVILDFSKKDDCLKTMSLSDTVLVQTEVDVPAEWPSSFHTDVAMSSGISTNVFDKNKVLVEDLHKGRLLPVVLRYSYTPGELSGIWIIENILE